jgi:hypothetical protein
MIWLIPYIGYALAASAVAGAAGYAAVTHFSVVQRVLAVAVDRALRKITDRLEGGEHSYHVEHTETGKRPTPGATMTQHQCQIRNCACEGWPITTVGKSMAQVCRLAPVHLTL